MCLLTQPALPASHVVLYRNNQLQTSHMAHVAHVTSHLGLIHRVVAAGCVQLPVNVDAIHHCAACGRQAWRSGACLRQAAALTGNDAVQLHPCLGVLGL